ncbi:Integrase/recombinase (plasmid) [Cupriavidus necator H850]|nr:Integrase/recombinase [Cupriavidus necator H850]
MRHSAASHQADAANDIRFIQKNLRHAHTVGEQQGQPPTEPAPPQ